MPSRAIGRICSNGARCQVADRFGPATTEPVCIRECDELLRIVRILIYVPFQVCYRILQVILRSSRSSNKSETHFGFTCEALTGQVTALTLRLNSDCWTTPAVECTILAPAQRI